MYIYITYIYWILAVSLSIFYGFKAVDIFQRPESGKNYRNFKYSWWVHQFWINFIGHLIGWIVLKSFFDQFVFLGAVSITNLSNLGSLFVGLLGIMGFLPLTVWNLATSFRSIPDLTSHFYKTKR